MGRESLYGIVPLLRCISRVPGTRKRFGACSVSTRHLCLAPDTNLALARTTSLHLLFSEQTFTSPFFFLHFPLATVKPIRTSNRSVTDRQEECRLLKTCGLLMSPAIQCRSIQGQIRLGRCGSPRTCPTAKRFESFSGPIVRTYHALNIRPSSSLFKKSRLDRTAIGARSSRPTFETLPLLPTLPSTSLSVYQTLGVSRSTSSFHLSS